MFRPHVWPSSERYKQEYKHKTAKTFCTDSFVIVFLFMSPWIWSHMRPKHVEGHPVIKRHQNTIMPLFVLLSYSLIDARDMNHAKWKQVISVCKSRVLHLHQSLWFITVRGQWHS